MAFEDDRTIGSAQFLTGTTNPDGVNTAPKGSIWIDNTNNKLYFNTDGSTAWTERVGTYPAYATPADLPTSADDGDWAYIASTGVAVRWEPSMRDGSGWWVRAWLYSKTLVNDGYSSGAVQPSTEGYTEFTAVGATITSDGTRVLLNSGNSPYGYVMLAASSADASYYINGYYRCYNVSDYDASHMLGRLIMIHNGSYAIALSLAVHDHDPVMRLVNWSPGGTAPYVISGSDLYDVSISTEAWIELYVDSANDTVKVYADWAADPLAEAAITDFATSATTKRYNIIRDARNPGGGADMTYRNVDHGVWS